MDKHKLLWLTLLRTASPYRDISLLFVCISPLSQKDKVDRIPLVVHLKQTPANEVLLISILETKPGIFIFGRFGL